MINFMQEMSKLLDLGKQRVVHVESDNKMEA